jgi:fumarate hydratase class II
MPARTEQAASPDLKISTERMPSELIAALALVKRACATANRELERLNPDTARAIDAAAEQVLAGRCDEHFPLSVWQTGSGMPTHANMNEVLADLASESLGGTPGSERLVRADEHVNLGQSSVSVFSAAIHVAASVGIAHNLLPALASLRAELMAKGEFCKQRPSSESLVQEISGHIKQLSQSYDAIVKVLPGVHELSIDSTNHGVPDSPYAAFGPQVAQALAHALELPFVHATDKFGELTSLDTLLALHGTLKSAALALMKVSGGMRALAPADVNQSQCDALTMVCCQVMGNDVALTIGAATEQLDGHPFKPLIAHNLLQSIRLLTDATTLFTEYFVRGITVNKDHISKGLASSLMLVTARVPQVA